MGGGGGGIPLEKVRGVQQHMQLVIRLHWSSMIILHTLHACILLIITSQMFTPMYMMWFTFFLVLKK